MDKNCYLVYSEHGFSNVLKEVMFKNSDCLFYNDNMVFIRTTEKAKDYWEKYLSNALVDNFITKLDVSKENMNMWGMLNKKVWRFLGVITEENTEKDEHSTGSTRQQKEGND